MFTHVNGIDMYYEVVGSGDPIILIHGNGESHDIFDVLAPELSVTHQVFLVDSRNHGRSTKVKGKLDYETMARDYIAFIRELKIEKPVIYGYSDGGIIGLLVAMMEQSLLQKLIISGANLNPKGLKLSSRLEMWPMAMLGNRLYRLMLHEPDIKPEDLSRIKIPVIVLAGENDVIREEHTNLIASSIPDSTLEIIPGEGHGSYIVHSEKLYPLIWKYL